VEVGAADDEVEVDVDVVEVSASDVVTGTSRVVDVEDVVDGTSIEEVLLTVELVEVELVEDVVVCTSAEVVIVDEVEDTLVDVVVVLDDEVEVAEEVEYEVVIGVEVEVDVLVVLKDVEVAGTDRVVPPGSTTFVVDPTLIVVVATLEVVKTAELVVGATPTVLVIVVFCEHNLDKGFLMLKIMRIPPMTQETSLTMAPGEELAVRAGMMTADAGNRMTNGRRGTKEGESHLYTRCG